jgi:hypothetical protein
MNQSRSYKLLLLLLLLSGIILSAGCDYIPFLRHLEIDKFPSTTQELASLEVSGVIYVRIVNPQHRDDPEAPATSWIPITVYQGGNYQAYTADLPRPKPEVTATTETQSPPAGTNTIGNTTMAGTTGEETLSPATRPSPSGQLRRRALLFPSQAVVTYPEIVSLLEIEIHHKLPLQIINLPADSTLCREGRLLSSRAEITTAARKWLDSFSGSAPPVQFVLGLTTRTDRDRTYFICTLVDAQTGQRAAAFTFIRGLDGRLWFPLVPNDPVPLVKLIEATSWWCQIRRDPQDDKLWLLTAGHASDLGYGHKLQVFRRAEEVHDPVSRKKLGYAFNGAVGNIRVIDFFAVDGAIARARQPLPDDFQQGYAVEIPKAAKPRAQPAGNGTPTQPQAGTQD